MILVIWLLFGVVNILFLMPLLLKLFNGPGMDDIGIFIGFFLGPWGTFVLLVWILLVIFRNGFSKIRMPFMKNFSLLNTINKLWRL